MSYFKEKDPHSELKHELYTKTLEVSLSIANFFNKKGSYTIVDLYAGQGKFDDGSKGSPILALETCLRIKNKINNMPISFVFVEKDKESYEKLEKETKFFLKDKQVCEGMNVFFGNGDWTKFEGNLYELLNDSSWGFIFADPFANEIDIQKFSDLLEHNYTKDVMVFINLIAIKRMSGNYKTRSKIAKFLQISEQELTDIISKNGHEAYLMKKVQEAFKLEQKHYNLFASLPTTRNGKLIQSNTFCLQCATNSIGVADSFLNTYADILSVGKTIQLNLFAEHQIEERIIEFLKNRNGKASLYDIVAYTMERFLSWRDHEPKEVPTTENVVSIINDMHKRKLLEWDTKEEYESFKKKNNTKYLNYKARNRNEALKATQIFLKEV